MYFCYYFLTNKVYLIINDTNDLKTRIKTNQCVSIQNKNMENLEGSTLKQLIVGNVNKGRRKRNSTALNTGVMQTKH